MLFCQFCQLRRLVLDQSSPVQPVSKSRGGSPECDRVGAGVVVVTGQFFSFLIQDNHLPNALDSAIFTFLQGNFYQSHIHKVSARWQTFFFREGVIYSVNCKTYLFKIKSVLRIFHGFFKICFEIKKEKNFKNQKKLRAY